MAGPSPHRRRPVAVRVAAGLAGALLLGVGPLGCSPDTPELAAVPQPELTWYRHLTPRYGVERLCLDVRERPYVIAGFERSDGVLMTLADDRWLPVALPGIVTCDAIWATRDGAVYAGGRHIARRRADGSWVDLGEPHPNFSNLYALWAPDSIRCHAIVDGRFTTWDGVAWQQVETGFDFDNVVVGGSGPDDVYVSSRYGDVAHWDGVDWTVEAAVASRQITSFYGAAPETVFAVAGGREIFMRTAAGWRSWEPDVLGWFSTVHGRAWNDVYAAAVSGELAHFDGESWTISSYVCGQVTSLWVSASGNVYLSCGNQVVRYAGDFSYALEPLGPETVSGQAAPWGDLFLACQPGAIVVVSPQASGEYGGTSRAVNHTADLTDVWPLDDESGVVVDAAGGISWVDAVVHSTLENRTPLRGVAARAARDLVAVGAGGELLRLDDAGWTREQVATTDLNDVWCDRTGDYVVVGDEGTILREEGSAWVRVTSGTEADLRAICGRRADDLHVLTADGTILDWNGEVWSRDHVPADRELRALCIDSLGDLYVAGAGGTLLRRRQGGWSELAVNTTADMIAVAVSPAGLVTAVDAAGYIHVGVPTR